MIIDVVETSQVASARRLAESVARSEGFDAELMGRVALVATELATNLVKHAAATGRLIVGRFSDSTGAGVELIAIDKGPGIREIDRAMEAGNSTTGTMGAGLPVIRRQSDLFEIYSRDGNGTVVAARIAHAATTDRTTGGLVLGTVVEPIRGETACGDQWGFADNPAGPTLLLVDGSGHGLSAQTAAKQAIATFNEHREEPLPRIMEVLHRALQPTRGAAASLARFDRSEGLVRYVGVGNVAGRFVSAGVPHSMVSGNGTVGHIVSRIREFTYPATQPTMIVMHSDGLSARWDFGDHPGLAFCHPSLVAGVLFRDYARDRDDASVVAMRV